MKKVTLEVDVQENGIIRNSKTKQVIGRLSEGIDYLSERVDPNYPRDIQITVNGVKHVVANTIMTYDDVARMAQGERYRPEQIYTTVYSVHASNIHGIIAPGETVQLQDNMVITCLVTGNA